MRWFTTLFILCWATTAHAGGNTVCIQWPDTGQPAAAATYGYTCLRLNPSFSTLNQVDVADTGDATKAVFTHSTFPGSPGGWGYETEPSTVSQDYSSVGGRLRIAITGDVNYAGLPTEFMSCRYSASLNPRVIGRTFGPGYYFEVKFSLDNSSAANSQTWAGAWMPSMTQLTGGSGARRVGEIDDYEFLGGANFQVHDWSFSGGSTVVFNDAAGSAFSSFSFVANTTYTLAALVVPKQYNDGTTGLIKRYLNGVHDGDGDISFTDAGTSSPAPAGGGHTGNFAALNTQEDCSSVTGGMGQVHAVEAWRVWGRG
jgi:hypothetical protein